MSETGEEILNSPERSFEDWSSLPLTLPSFEDWSSLPLTLPSFEDWSSLPLTLPSFEDWSSLPLTEPVYVLRDYGSNMRSAMNMSLYFTDNPCFAHS